jgi:poly(A) polymerase
MKRLFDAFLHAGKELYLVGGAVRDLALGVHINALDDLDFCTNARPEESLQILKDAGFTTYDMGIEFGTVGCVLSGRRSDGYPKDCQVTTYRSEEYYRRGSRHPIVRFGDTIMQDLKRRDFSINSIALDHNGAFVDPYDGLGDLRRKVLRVVGDPLETLAEDPLRILRIGRFVSRLGFEVDEALRAAAFENADHILEISRERWLQEMSKLLCSKKQMERI